MYLIEGDETAEDVLALAYGLEDGARRFYRELALRSDLPEARRLFETLSNAEIRHKDRLWDRYRALPGKFSERQAFEESVVPGALEGGLTADQLITRYPESVRQPAEAFELAMALETDALDLYLRMSDAFDDKDVRAIFLDLAEEERVHLKKIGDLRGHVP